jgi:hypothetical protein
MQRIEHVIRGVAELRQLAVEAQLERDDPESDNWGDGELLCFIQLPARRDWKLLNCAPDGADVYGTGWEVTHLLNFIHGVAARYPSLDALLAHTNIGLALQRNSFYVCKFERTTNAQ